MRTELWVIDVGRAMTGDPVACDGSSPACVRMTDKLFTGFRLESPSHPEAHRFEGDTLFFLAGEHPAAAKLARYEGYVWTWRPGWRRPRRITSDRGVLCRGSESAPIAFCVDGVTDRPLEFDLRAGRVDDTDESLLPVVERIAPLHDGELAWSAGFSRSGELAFSSWRAGETAESLRVVRFADLDPKRPKTVTTSVVDGWGWTLSPDGGAVYFLRNRAPTTGAGTLWAADFPSGGNPTAIAAAVSDYAAVGAESVVFLTDVRGLEGVLHLVKDRRQPEGRSTLARDTHAWYPLADDRFTYILQVDRDGERGLIADTQRGVTCPLASREEVTVFGASMLPELGVVSWTEPDPAGGLDLRFLGRPADCGGKQALGPGIELLQAVGATGLIFGSRADADSRALTMHHLPTLGQGSAQVIISEVDPENVARTGGPRDFLLLGTGGGEVRGLFGYGPLGAAQ